MRDPKENHIKAWAKEYEEKPFCFLDESESGKRLVAWSEDPIQIKKAFYALLDDFPENVEVLLKISAGETSDNKPLWSRYRGDVDRWKLNKVVQENEVYVFADGMHQLCVMDKQTRRYFAFDDHGIFFVYKPTSEDFELFQSLNFENRQADPIFAMPHFQHVPPDPEKLEMKFVTELRLVKSRSDLE